MIEDGAIANMYAIEAIATFDHFHFRKVMQTVTSTNALGLWYPGKPNAPPTPWWKSYYDTKDIHMRDRLLFAAQPLPPGLASTKNVDWSAVDAAAAKPPATKGKSPAKGAKTPPSKSSGKKKPAKKKPTKKAPAKKAKKPAKKTSSAKKKKGAKKKAPAKKKAKPRSKK